MEPLKKRQRKAKPAPPQHGGKRANSGRKPVADPKQGLTIFIPTSEVILLGGAVKAREIATEYLHTQAQLKSVEELLS